MQGISNYAFNLLPPLSNAVSAAAFCRSKHNYTGTLGRGLFDCVLILTLLVIYVRVYRVSRLCCGIFGRTEKEIAEIDTEERGKRAFFFSLSSTFSIQCHLSTADASLGRLGDKVARRSEETKLIVLPFFALNCLLLLRWDITRKTGPILTLKAWKQCSTYTILYLTAS